MPCDPTGSVSREPQLQSCKKWRHFRCVAGACRHNTSSQIRALPDRRGAGRFEQQLLSRRASFAITLLLFRINETPVDVPTVSASLFRARSPSHRRARRPCRVATHDS
jgi:hypothetical protein